MKYHNKKIKTDEGTFDSLKEYKRYQQLVRLEKAGYISGLKRQQRYLLIPAQDGPTRHERPCVYIADFVYAENGKAVVEDVKGMRTDVYKIKRKLMLERYGIEVREI